jgi:hypothetical protein
MTITTWDYGFAEETFASGSEPRVVTFGDGTQAMMTSWLSGEHGRKGVFSSSTTVAWLTRWKDDVGAWIYRWTECNWDEYFKWLDECRIARAALRAPPSYHEQDVPDFIGEEMWKEHPCD